MKDIIIYFGLKSRPFDKSIRSSKVLETEPLKEANARLDYIRNRGGMMLLTGDPGVGKTLALRAFVDHLNDNRFRTVYTPLSTLKGTDILRHINHCLGLPYRPTKSALFSQIQHEVLESRDQRGKTLVLILDEAQLLPNATLHEIRLLTNFRMDSYDPFILILAGQTELRRIMDYAVMEPFAQRLAMRFHMPPLDPAGTAQYVRHHMKLAGATQSIFHDDALSALHELSYGIPRRIGSLAEHVLIYAAFAERQTVDADTVLKATAGQ